MDINNIALIIVTAFINLAVSNYIFFRYQKKIEDSFAKSMLEYQTKFVRNHEKRTEALEILYSKYKAFIDYLFKILDIPEGVTIQPPSSQTDDLNKYYSTCRLYFSDDEIIELDNIITTSINLTIFMLVRFEPESYSRAKITWANKIIKTCGLNLTTLDIDNLNTKLLKDELGQAIRQQEKRIEKLYSSIANIK